jgi:hypothetical protein
MESDLLNLVISNLPNFVGFAILAVILWDANKRADARIAALTDALIEQQKQVVEMLLQNRAALNAMAAKPLQFPNK